MRLVPNDRLAPNDSSSSSEDGATPIAQATAHLDHGVSAWIF